MKNNILEVTNNLIKIPSSLNRPEAMQQVFDYAKNFFQGNKKLFLKTYLQNNKASLVVSTVDGLFSDVLMIGHLDVVDAEQNMFEPKIEDGRLIGRGACDMKSEDAVMMCLMNELSELPKPPSVALMLTSDEEVGGGDGVKYLINSIGYRCGVALVPDGSSSPEELILANKGVLHLRLSAKGIPAHGSTPWLGENALDKLIQAILKVKILFPPGNDVDRWYNTCNLGLLSGGKAANQVPDSAFSVFDIRFVETESVPDILERVKQTVPECEVETIVTGYPCSSAFDNQFIQLYSNIIKEKFKLTPHYGKNCSGHDGRYLSVLGIPVIVTRPISGDQHSEKEWVDIESLNIFKEIYYEFIIRVATR